MTQTKPAAAISAYGILKKFSDRTVLDGVDISVGPGTVFGLVGLNGAGKTTLIRLLLGLLGRDGGSLDVLGYDPWSHRKEFYRSAGVVLEHDGFMGNLTFRENIEFFASARQIPTHALNQYLDKFWNGMDIVSRGGRVSRFSRGQRMQCALCRAFMGWPQVCFLDEPVVALDIDACEHFGALVRHARSLGSAILISSNQLETVEDLCDTVGVLQNGKIRMLDCHGKGAQLTSWIIDADPVPRYGAVIAGLGGADVRYEQGAWRLNIRDARDSIPPVIAALVEARCAIRGVRPDSGALKREMRRPESGAGNGRQHGVTPE